MSKKNKLNRTNNRAIIPFDVNKGTILDQLETFLEQRDSVSDVDVIQFLCIQDARWLHICARNDGCPPNREDELIEFYEYFMEYFDEDTAEFRSSFWMDDAFVLTLAEDLMAEREETLYNEHIANASTRDLAEAQLLVNTLFSIRKDRAITYCSASMTKESVYLQSIPEELLDPIKKEMLDACLFCVEDHGAIVVRCFNDDETCDLFGIRVNPNGVWQPISKEEMLDAHTLTSDGSRIEPEEGVNYTEIERKIYSYSQK